MRRLTVVEARGDAGFVDQLRRAWDAGDAVLPLDPRLPAPARERVLAAARVQEPVEEGDALVVATSGTTGHPKAVVLTHRAVEAAARATSRRLGADPDRDRWLACLPLAHVGGLGVVTRALATGVPLRVVERPGGEELRAAAAAGCTLVSLVPALLPRIDPAAFRVIVLGGSAMPPDVPVNAVTTYGMTETGGGVVYDGVPLEGVEVRTVPAHGPDGHHPGGAATGEGPPSGAAVASGAGTGPGDGGGSGERAPPGEVHLRGPMLLRGYRDGTDPRGAGGWLPTGDAGRWDADRGRLEVTGRMGDVIVTGGENVWPVAVEEVLGRHPAVGEVLVFGRPDPDWGERVVARVVPADPAVPPTLDALRGSVREQLGPWAAPRELELATELPRTALGKLRRAAT